jgi:hypothetical protein
MLQTISPHRGEAASPPSPPQLHAKNAVTYPALQLHAKNAVTYPALQLHAPSKDCLLPYF